MCFMARLNIRVKGFSSNNVYSKYNSHLNLSCFIFEYKNGICQVDQKF